VFRTWTPDDSDLAVGLWGDPDVAHYLAAFDGVPSKAWCLERLAREIASREEHGIQYWPVFLRDGAHVGCAGLRPYNSTAGILELGVHIRPAYWRQGLAVEAGRAVIAHAFDKLDARGLFAGHHPQNDASMSMLKRLGFRYSHDERYEPTGLMHPSYVLEPPSSHDHRS
jgi:RimJ/RimL family protein N-acetyltransferase